MAAGLLLETANGKRRSRELIQQEQKARFASGRKGASGEFLVKPA